MMRRITAILVTAAALAGTSVGSVVDASSGRAPGSGSTRGAIVEVAPQTISVCGESEIRVIGSGLERTIIAGIGSFDEASFESGTVASSFPDVVYFEMGRLLDSHDDPAVILYDDESRPTKFRVSLIEESCDPSSITTVTPSNISVCGGTEVTIEGVTLDGVVSGGITEDRDLNRLAAGNIVSVTSTRVVLVTPSRPADGPAFVWLRTATDRLISKRVTLVADGSCGEPPSVPVILWSVRPAEFSRCGGSQVLVRGAGLNRLGLLVGLGSGPADLAIAPSLQSTEGTITMTTPRRSRSGRQSVVVSWFDTQERVATLPVTLTGRLCPATPPISLSAAPTSTALALRWSAPLDDGGQRIAGYRVQIAEGKGRWVTVTSSASTRGRHTVTGLTPRTSYRVRVAAVGKSGKLGEWSLVIAARTKA